MVRGLILAPVIFFADAVVELDEFFRGFLWDWVDWVYGSCWVAEVDESRLAFADC